MVHYTNALATTEQLREIPREDQREFPYIAIQSDLEAYADRCSSWHWHDYFEFATVSGGTMELCTQRQNLRISDGEGYFVNSNVLHLCRVADGSAGARLQVHQFDGSLIGASDCVRRKYIQPVQNCGALDALKLERADGRFGGVLDNLDAAFNAACREPEGFEISISVCLMQAWKMLHAAAGPLLGEGGRISSVDVERIKAMLACIHTRYGEGITVSAIAESANICVREAHRCFRQVLGTTPVLYLMRHRVNAAARLLAETHRSITDIALSCGFSSSSYFCKVFRDVMGRPPREFRKNSGSEK